MKVEINDTIVQIEEEKIVSNKINPPAEHLELLFAEDEENTADRS